MHSRFNNADEIERDLGEDGTYDRDDDWDTFMKHLREKIRDTLDFSTGWI